MTRLLLILTLSALPAVAADAPQPDRLICYRSEDAIVCRPGEPEPVPVDDPLALALGALVVGLVAARRMRK